MTDTVTEFEWAIRFSSGQIGPAIPRQATEGWLRRHEGASLVFRTKTTAYTDWTTA